MPDREYGWGMSRFRMPKPTAADPPQGVQVSNTGERIIIVCGEQHMSVPLRSAVQICGALSLMFGLRFIKSHARKIELGNPSSEDRLAPRQPGDGDT
jgi:hypothetical protein